MKIAGRSELDRLEKIDKYRRYLYSVIFVICLVVVFFGANSHFERRAATYQNATKVSVIGTFKSTGSSKHGTLCFFEIDGYSVIPVRCSYDYYEVGQKVKLTKITLQSGKVYFEILDKWDSLTPPLSGTR